MNEDCIECGNTVVKTAYINQPKDTCFDCWFKRDVASDDIHPCGCKKDKSEIYLKHFTKGMKIFLIVSVSIAWTITGLYFLGIRP